MIITHNGIESFRIQFGDTVLALNPVSKASKHASASFGADIVLVSLNHPDMNGVDTVSRGEKEPFVITGPGEYEVGGVYVKGYQSQSQYDGKEAINTVYAITLEDMQLVFVGALSGQLSPEILEDIDVVDVLFVPIGDDGVLNPVEAHKLATNLEAAIVVPMHYEGAGVKNSLATFLKEEGSSNGKPVEKLTLKAKDLTGKTGEIIVLKAQ